MGIKAKFPEFECVLLCMKIGFAQQTIWRQLGALNPLVALLNLMHSLMHSLMQGDQVSWQRHPAGILKLRPLDPAFTRRSARLHRWCGGCPLRQWLSLEGSAWASVNDGDTLGREILSSCAAAALYRTHAYKKLYGLGSLWS